MQAAVDVSHALTSFLEASGAELASIHGGAPPPSLVAGVVGELCRAGQGELAASFYLHEVERAFRHEHLPRAWAGLGEGCGEEGALVGVVGRLDSLASGHRALVSALADALTAAGSSLGGGLLERFHTVLCALLLESAPADFAGSLGSFYAARLSELGPRAMRHMRGLPPLAPGEEIDEDEDSEEEEEDDAADGEGGGRMEGVEGAPGEPGDVMGREWAARVADVAGAMRSLRLGALSEEAYSAAICDKLRVCVGRWTQGSFDRAILPRIRRWVGAVPLPFLSLLVGAGPGEGGEPGEEGGGRGEALRQWRARLEFIGYETLGAHLTGSLFDIIIDFPESLPAVEDLRECLANTHHHPKLVASFRQVVRRRLLHPGAATTDIIHQYVGAIKTLRVLDPSGVVLEAVGEPIREYLRQRKDTIRCIVTMLTDDSGDAAGESLFEELGRGGAGGAGGEGGADDAAGGGDMEGDEAALAALELGDAGWEPDPVDANPNRPTSSRRMTDIIGMLVGIYGSKELFISEYRAMLADKLLAKDEYETEREVRTLELLKLRFGESSLHSCEVMVRDLADSKRINNNVKNAPPPSPGGGKDVDMESWGVDLGKLNSTVVSSLFWPPFQTGESIKGLLDAYADRFHNLKSPRKLLWKTHLGTVRLELEFQDRTAEFTVSPVHAAMIMQFEDKPTWRAEDLAAALGISPATLRRRAVLWVNQGVLAESRGAGGGVEYRLVSSLSEAASAAGAAGGGGEDEADSAVASSEQQLAQEMSVYESYVIGMLTNFDALPLDRIHNMLKMFVAEPPYDKSAQQLAAFLAKLVAEEKLVVEGNLYRRRQ